MYSLKAAVDFKYKIWQKQRNNLTYFSWSVRNWQRTWHFSFKLCHLDTSLWRSYVDWSVRRIKLMVLIFATQCLHRNTLSPLPYTTFLWNLCLFKMLSRCSHLRDICTCSKMYRIFYLWLNQNKEGTSLFRKLCVCARVRVYFIVVVFTVGLADMREACSSIGASTSAVYLRLIAHSWMVCCFYCSLQHLYRDCTLHSLWRISNQECSHAVII